MEAIPHLLVMLLVLLPLWAVISSPVLAAFFLLARFMRRKSARSACSIVAFAFVFSLLTAPVPTPILTVFVPHGLVLFDPSYYPNILHGPAMFAGLWRWIIPSLILTFVVSLAAAWRYLRRRPPTLSSKPTPHRGQA